MVEFTPVIHDGLIEKPNLKLSMLRLSIDNFLLPKTILLSSTAIQDSDTEVQEIQTISV